MAGRTELRAEPLLTLLVGRDLDGSRRFADDLSRIWSNRDHPTDERLAVSQTGSARIRLRALERSRGHFAIVSAEEASQYLGDHPRLRVIGGLWLIYLHALTRDQTVQSLSLPLRNAVWVTENAAYAHHALWEWSQETPLAREMLEIFPTPWIPDLLYNLGSEVLLFAAPVPLEEITAELQRDSTLRLLPFDGGLLDEFRLAYPWLQTAVLPGSAYQKGAVLLEWPGRRMLMVADVALPEPSARKMLESLYETREGAALFNPLFGQYDTSVNKLLARILPFHPVSAKYFGLTEDGTRGGASR